MSAETIIEMPDEPFITTRVVENGVLKSTVRSIRATEREQAEAELAAYERQLPYMERELALKQSREFWGAPDSAANKAMTEQQHKLEVEDIQMSVDAEKAELKKAKARVAALSK